MCTLTLIPEAQGYTLTMNRDEFKSRAEAGLRQHREGSVEASFPVDGVAGGTWVGVNDRGVSLALLNRYQAPSITDAKSRGNIIKNAIFKKSANDILAFLKALDVRSYNPFNLIMIDNHSVYQFHWDREEYRWDSRLLHQPMMFTSSSERFEQVSAYRQARFTKCLAERTASRNIEQFHLSQQPGRESDSVLMSREKVHTKSIVRIRVDSYSACLDYFDTESIFDNRVSLQSATHSNLLTLKAEAAVLADCAC